SGLRRRRQRVRCLRRPARPQDLPPAPRLSGALAVDAAPRAEPARMSWRSATARFVDNRARPRLDALMRRLGLLVVFLALAACGGEGGRSGPPAKASATAPRRDALAGGPYPAILVAQAQFTEGTGPDGKPAAIPGAAKLLVVRKTENGWKPLVLEDPD